MLELVAVHVQRQNVRHPLFQGVPILGTLLLIVLVLILVGSLPVYPYSRKWGYAPGGVLGLLLVIMLVMVLMGRI